MVEVVPAPIVKSKEEFFSKVLAAAPYVLRYQWDLMDGKFVQNSTFSDPSVLDELFLKLANLNPGLKIEADLMVEDPQNWIERLRHPGVDQLIFHFESKEKSQDWKNLLLHARALGFKVGIANEPETPLSEFSALLPLVDRYQAMGGRSGFGGQKFNPEVLPTIKKIRADFPLLPISVDIGVNPETIPQMVEAGVTILCAGSAIFGAEDIQKAIESLRNAAV